MIIEISLIINTVNEYGFGPSFPLRMKIKATKKNTKKCGGGKKKKKICVFLM